MKPAPGKGVSSFPTPVIKDTVIVEVVNAWKGDYQPLEYGTKWDDVPHASVQGSFPDHKLINQSPNSEDGQWVKRIWANDRVDQDTYNYAIKYSGGSDAHPIYIRTYVELRETYAPVPDLSPDPLFPNALLVEEEVQRQDNELDSRYVKVIRTYETLPGPVISSKRYNDRGDLETVNTQQVSPSTIPDPDGLLVTQSQVIKEDVSKGTKTTATVEQHSVLTGSEKKSGLLANTTVTDSIVSPSTQPDNLTFTGSGGVVESSVSPISKTKSKKTTVTSTGPVSLATNTLVDSPIGLVKATVEKSIVDTTVQPQNGPLVLRDSINKTDEVKSERERVTVVQEWPKVYGTWVDSANGIILPYYETVIDSSNGLVLDDYNEYEPIDATKTKVRVYDRDQVDALLRSNWATSRQAQEVQIRLPNKLKQVTAYFGLDNGQGESNGEGTGAGNSYNYSFTKSFTTSSSATGDIYFKLEKGYDGVVDGYKYIFYGGPSSSRSGVINFLNDEYNADIKPYPQIKMISENIVIIGGSKSESTSESESASISLNGNSTSFSSSKSYNVSVSANSVVVPESLHEEIEVAISPTGSLGELPINYQVYPPTLAATTPPQFEPGEYLMSVNVERYKFNFFKYTCITAVIESEYT
jgi:hypothetical protein